MRAGRPPVTSLQNMGEPHAQCSSGAHNVREVLHQNVKVRTLTMPCTVVPEGSSSQLNPCP